MDETRRGRLTPGDWDGITRAEAFRRLLALADQPARRWPRGRWIARLKATWAALRALWR